jgi:hypothetical protein
MSRNAIFVLMYHRHKLFDLEAKLLTTHTAMCVVLKKLERIQFSYLKL